VTAADGTITAQDVQGWIRAYADVVAEHRAELSRLDQAIGDGDHGTNMDRGMRKAVEKVDALDGPDVGTILKSVGMALISSVGGAAGPLYGTLFIQMASASTGEAELDLAGWAAALDAGVQGVQKRGKAEAGDKTMVDALLPAAEALRAAESEGASLPDALKRCADAAEEGMLATTPMEAKKGRASYLGPRSVGHQDPGATSTHLLLRSAAEAFAGGAG
jgi:dihydroxyacetone kinase-like protein